MTVSEDIFQLIKSLSQTEKTYFKKFAQLHVLHEENVYLRLFDAIDAQEKYDEKLLTEIFSKGKSASQFSVLKNYLYSLILKSLRNYHAEDTVRAELRQQLQNTSLLFERGLHTQAEKLLRRCRKTAEQCELFRELIEISALEQVILLFGKSYDASTIKTMNAVLDERTLLLQKMQNTYDYDRLEYNLTHLFQSGNKTDLVKAGKLMKNELLKNEKQALCVVSRLKFHHIHSTYSYYSRKPKECIVHLQKELQILETHPEIMQLRMQDYVLLTNNVLLLLLEMNDYKKFDTRLTQFRKQLAQQTISVRLWEQAVLHNWIIEMQWHYHVFDYPKFCAVAYELQKTMKQHKAELKLNDRLVFLDLQTRAAFRAKKFNEALSHSVELLNHSEAPRKFQQYNSARFFNLLIHFELGNYDLLDYQIQSFNRQVMKAEKSNALYNAIIPFLKKYPSTIDKKQRQALVEKTAKEVSESGYYDFKEWISSKT
ncbi:MAG: hypothetical protein JNK66_11100 [Chitinophagales bacterium]|nr:hypothetical protein [Chitinophagales bacterium]